MAESPDRPLIIGLTGSVGMGKSTVALMLRELDVPVFDADAEVHRLQGPGGALVGPIEEAFPGTTGPDGVDRKRLSPLVLGKPDALKKLEDIVHPAVRAQRGRFLQRHADAPLICFDIPLLFETGGEKDVDVVLVVSAPAELQRERVMARPAMTREKLDSILALQLPDGQKRERADFVIENGGALEDTEAQVRKIVAILREEPAKWLASRRPSDDI